MPLQTDLMLLRILVTVSGVFPELIVGRLTVARSSNESHCEGGGNWRPRKHVYLVAGITAGVVRAVGLVGYQRCTGTAWTVNEKTENTKAI